MKPETKQELRDEIESKKELLEIQSEAIDALENKLYPQKIYLDEADIGIILTLLFHESLSLKTDVTNLECIKDPANQVSDAVLHTLYQQQGRLKKLANKIKDQALRDYDFDTALQAVVPTN
jgi:flagellar biosynthesis component FlhA